MGTLKNKWGPNGDPKSEKGPHGDPGPQMGTHVGAVCLMDADIKLHVIFCNIYAHDAIWTKQHCSNWFSSLCDSSQYGFYKSNMIKALFYRGTTNVAFELCVIAQIGALLRVHQPDFVLAKNTIQFLPEVFSSSNF